MRHLLSLADWSAADVEALVARAAALKADPGPARAALADRTLLMIFEKPSLRTRVSFEAAMLELGGHALFYDLAGSPWRAGKETPEDTARTASRYVDAIMARLYRTADLEGLARGASVPVINGLTDLEHPCQAVGDLLTIQERFGRLQGVQVAYVGDGRNNVLHSLMDGCGHVGAHLRCGVPAGAEFAPDADVSARAATAAAGTGGSVIVAHDAGAAVRGAQVVYTDTWMSYHTPPESHAAREAALTPFRVTEALMAQAAPEAIFMHCLPAQRGMEVTAAVMDGPQSVVFDQAENRLHSEKAILLACVADRRIGSAPPAP
jgi:ornithine carbamoyltransferase